MGATIVLLGVDATRGLWIGHVWRKDYYPGTAACLDRAVGAMGATRGIGLYWEARKYTMLSKTHVLEIAQVSEDLSPYLWINNDRDYDDPFRFVVVPDRSKDADVLVKNLGDRWGPPAAEKRCAKIRVLFWSKPFEIGNRGTSNG